MATSTKLASIQVVLLWPASRPALSVPRSIARKVPDSNKALPPINSPELSTCGNKPYLAGAKNVECAPIMNSANNSNTTLCCAKPMPATIMMAISNALMHLRMRALSKRSPSWPASPENTTKGSMNRPAAILASNLGSSVLHRVA